MKIILNELIILWVVSPLMVIKSHHRHRYAKLIGEQWDGSDVLGFDIENIKETPNELALRIRTFGTLIPDDLIWGKSRAKIFEALNQNKFLLRSLSYDKLTRNLLLQFFSHEDFEDEKILEVAQKLEMGFTDLEIRSNLHLYPQFINYEIIDKEEAKEDNKSSWTIYTIKVSYQLPWGLAADQISPSKVKALASYVRLPLYEHKLKAHEDVLELYVEINPRPLEKMKFTDFDPPVWIRVPLGFDLKYRKQVYLNFDQWSVQKGDYGFAPHYIIAGATSSGKSNFIKFVILQLLRSNSPDDLRFFLVDPKVVTFSIFNKLPHLYAPVVSDATKFKVVLDGIVEEVEKRYKILAEHNVENISQLKGKFKKQGGEHAMPHILVIVDEFADIIDSQNWKIREDIILALKRLGQKARAAGVHLILITQRATTTNIDGEVKANMPGRIAFKVASEWDSQIVIEDSCAADVENPGEWYAKIGDTEELVHFQAPYVSEEDIQEELKKYVGVPIHYINESLSKEIMKELLAMDEVTPDRLPQMHFPSVSVWINLKSHEIVLLHFAREQQMQSEEPTPHLVISWATNSGKSRFAKLLVHQLSYSWSPDDVRILLIDPKVVTFSVFMGLPHLYCPIITEYDHMLPKLEEVLSLIQARYKIFAQEKVENINGYRTKLTKQWRKIPKDMYSLVIIIDEFADMLDSYDYKGREQIEKILKRFGQMARAAGVHMVIITQRANSQNIPGEVRTHFAGRIAFRMNTEADSYYILEEKWAEKLRSSGMFMFKQADNEIQYWYAPLFHNDELERMVEDMRRKFIS